MKANQRLKRWPALAVLLSAILWSGRAHAANVASIQSGDWENTATWDCGCVPGAGDTITISNGDTVKVSATHHTGSVTVNGILDTNDQFFEFEGATLANNGSIMSSTGSFGEIDFAGAGAVSGTTQTIAGTGTYAGGASFPVEIHLANNTTVTPASGTVISGARNLYVPSGSTLSLTNALIFSNGSLTTGSGTLSGGGTLKTQGTVTLVLNGSTSAPLEVVSGTTTGSGNYGQVTIDSGATLLQGGTLTTNGNMTVNGTLDTNNQFFEFQGATFSNNSAVICGAGNFGEIDFIGVGGASGTMQVISGMGTYAGVASLPVEIHLGNTTTVTPASGTVISGVRTLYLPSDTTLSLPTALVFRDGSIFAGNGTITGPGTLKTQGGVALTFSGSTTAPLEVVNGTTTGNGSFGQITIDNSATMFLSGLSTPSGNLNVASGGTLDMNNQFLVFQGVTFTNNGLLISSTGFGEIDFNGINGVGATIQNVAGTGSYDTSGRNDMRLLGGVTVMVASGSALNGVTFITIDAGATFDFTGSGSLTLAGGVNNSGTVTLNGGGEACGDATRILIRSSVMGVQRAWAGAGTFALTDVDVKDQGGSAALTVTGGTDSGNNGANWSFGACPTPTPMPSPQQLLNISTRLNVLTETNVLIGGFIITGTTPKKVIIRAIGPSLGKLGVAGALTDPVLELHEPGDIVVTNDNWRDTQEAEIMATTIPPTDDLESAIVATLAPGAYTAIVSGNNGGTGVALVEAYDLDQAAGQLANISTRGFVNTDPNEMIGGFIVGGGSDGQMATVLVRAIGPSLTAFGVQGAVQDPTLELHDGNGNTLLTNDNWKDTQEAEIAATTIQPTDDLESAILATLGPGGYTAIVRGKDNTTGVGLVEAYNLQ